MKTSETKTSRNRSRGPRRGRRGGRANNNSNGSRTSSAKSPRPAPKPKTFWEKILAFFSGGGSSGKGKSSSASKPARSSSLPSVDTRPTSAAKPAPGNASRSGSNAPRTKRVPENVEVTSSRLYVGNLSFDAGESDLFELFNGVGQVQYAEVVSNPHTHRSKGFAFVQMQTIEEAKRAVRELHNKDFMGRPLVVSGAKSQREDEPSESPSEAASA